jgi:hypothetical protein
MMVVMMMCGFLGGGKGECFELPRLSVYCILSCLYSSACVGIGYGLMIWGVGGQR